MMKYAGEMLSRFPGGVVDTKLYSNGRKTGFPFFFLVESTTSNIS